MIPVNLTQVIDHIFSTRQISRADQHQLMSLLFDTGLGEQEKQSVNQIYEALSQGRIHVVD